MILAAILLTLLLLIAFHVWKEWPLARVMWKHFKETGDRP